MLAFLLGLFRMFWLFGKDHRGVVLENVALRQQLSVYKRKHQRPPFAARDRWFWIALSGLWKDWRQALVVVHPDSVVRWQRERFRRYWSRLSKRPGIIGRPPISLQVRTLIRTLAEANPLWRAPRIHGELLKLGIAVSERTVSRVLQTITRHPSQTWRTFLRNHVGKIVAIDFFTVPTIRLRVLFVFLGADEFFILTSPNIRRRNGRLSKWLRRFRNVMSNGICSGIVTRSMATSFVSVSIPWL